MNIMKAHSLEFVEEMAECLNKTMQNGSNLTSDSDLIHSTCNETMLKKIDVYVTPLLESDFVMAVSYCCLVCAAMSVGIAGNIIIVIVTTVTRTMNKIGRDFVVNLALSDLCVNAIADPLCIFGVVKGERWFNGRRILCEVAATACLIACLCAFLSLTLLTLNRYVFVCLHRWYDKIFKRRVCIMLCVVCWAGSLLVDFPSFFGWGGHYFDQKNHQCIWDRTADFSYTLFITAGLFGGLVVLNTLCFVLVFRNIWLTKKEILSLENDGPLRKRRLWTEALKSSRTLVIIFVAFVVCWGPYAIVTALDINDSYSVEVHLFVAMMAHFHSSLNFAIYMWSNRRFRRAVQAFFFCSLTSFTKSGYKSYTGTTSFGTTVKTVSRLTRKDSIHAQQSSHCKTSFQNGVTDQQV